VQCLRLSKLSIDLCIFRLCFHADFANALLHPTGALLVLHRVYVPQLLPHLLLQRFLLQTKKLLHHRSARMLLLVDFLGKIAREASEAVTL
jgi:hypothetical protein